MRTGRLKTRLPVSMAQTGLLSAPYTKLPCLSPSRH